MFKFLIKILFILFIFTSCQVFADVRKIIVEKKYVGSSEVIEKLLKENSSNLSVMVFTRVPRGLIVSIDERYIFNDESPKIKQSALPILNDILTVLWSVDTLCVVEGHTESHEFSGSPYDYNWELSLLRAGNIVKYFITYGKISPERLFSLGFGEFMPSVDNVDEKMHVNNRIDFVFIDYQKNTRQ